MTDETILGETTENIQENISENNQETNNVQNEQETVSWKSSLNEEYQQHPSLKDIKDINGLVKTYIHAQQLIGVDKVVIPKEDSNPELVEEFYSKIGRPEAPGGYELTKPENAANDFLFYEEALPEFQTKFHELGLTKTQGEKLFNHYNEWAQGLLGKAQQETEQKITEGISELKKEWGFKFEPNLSIAKRAVENFGGEELKNYLNETGLGNDPRLIKAFAKIGESFKEDSTFSNPSVNSGVLTPQSAREEISKLNMDKAFMSTYLSATAQGNKEAKEKMNNLFKMAYPE